MSARPAAKMFLAAFTSRSWTVPHAAHAQIRDAERFRAVLDPAGRAHLAGGLEPADPGERAAILSRLLLDAPASAATSRRLGDRPGQPRPHQPADGQVFGVDRLVIADQPQRRLMRVIKPRLPHLTMQAATRCPALARFADPFCRRDSTRCAFFSRRCAVRRNRGLGITSPSEVTASWRAPGRRRSPGRRPERGSFAFHYERGVVPAVRFFDHRDRRGNRRQRTGPFDPAVSHLSDVQPLAVEGEPVAGEPD